MKEPIKFLLASFLCLSLFLLSDHYNDYMTDKLRCCEVLKRYDPVPHYKSSGNFVLVLKDKESGCVFDMIVSATTFYKSEYKKEMCFELRRFDMQQNGWENFYMFFGHVALSAAGFVCFLIGSVWLVSKLFK